jgi:hypothetical protein
MSRTFYRRHPGLGSRAAEGSRQGIGKGEFVLSKMLSVGVNQGFRRVTGYLYWTPSISTRTTLFFWSSTKRSCTSIAITSLNSTR